MITLPPEQPDLDFEAIGLAALWIAERAKRGIVDIETAIQQLIEIRITTNQVADRGRRG